MVQGNSFPVFALICEDDIKQGKKLRVEESGTKKLPNSYQSRVLARRPGTPDGGNYEGSLKPLMQYFGIICLSVPSHRWPSAASDPTTIRYEQCLGL